MATKRVSLDTLIPIEEAYLTLSELSEELSKGKAWKNLFEIWDTFGKSGGWWMRSKDNDKHVIKLMFKKFNTKTIYITASLASLRSGGTIASFEARVLALLDPFRTMEVPLEIITSKFRERVVLAERQ
jgi:hypothetical protein